MPGINPIPTGNIADIFVNPEREVGFTKAQLALEKSKQGEMDADKIKAAAKDFEAVFLGQMLQAMVPKEKGNPLFGGGDSDETFRTMMVDEYAKSIAASGGIGIASHIERELLGEASLASKPTSYDLPIGKAAEAYQKTQAETAEADEVQQQGGAQ